MEKMKATNTLQQGYSRTKLQISITTHNNFIAIARIMANQHRQTTFTVIFQTDSKLRKDN